jgi:energy-converting hydrogenase A subunit M
LIQNRLNRLENDDKFIEEVMKSTTEFSEIVRKEALDIFARKADFAHAHKYTKRFDVQNFLGMLGRVTAENKLGLTPQILADFVEALTLGCKDFVKIAFVTKTCFNPQENLTLFRSFQTADANAQQAYLYLLFEYELMEQVDIYLSEQDESDFVKFRALYTLKKEHSQFKLEDLMDIDTLCNEVRL